MPDAYSFMLGVVANARGVGPGVDELFAYAQRVQPGPLWRKLKRMDFAADARGIERGLRSSLRAAKIPARYRGFYCGLDCLNLGQGIELGLSTTWRARGEPDDTEWATDSDLYPDRIPSPARDQMIQATEDDLADLLFGVGYIGLALRRAFERVDPGLLLGGAKARGVCWGHHDGDLWSLGVIRPDGFHPTPRDREALPPARKKPKPAAIPEAPTLEALARELVADLPASARGSLEEMLESLPELAAERALGPEQRLEWYLGKDGDVVTRAIQAWRGGRMPEYRAAVASVTGPKQFKREELWNGHHEIYEVATLAKVLELLGDRAAIAALYASGLRLANAVRDARVSSWVLVAVLAKLAVVAHRGGLDAARQMHRDEATRLAATVEPPHATTARLSIQDMCDELGDLEGALAQAKRTGHQVAELLARLGRISELRAHLAAEPEPAARAKLAVKAAMAVAQ